MTLDLVLDAIVITGSLILMLFCVVLARRLRRLNDLEQGLGGAIAVMAAEIDRLDQSIRLARQEATIAGEALATEVQKAQAERARWDLYRKMREAVAFEPESERGGVTRLRRRRISADA